MSHTTSRTSPAMAKALLHENNSYRRRDLETMFWNKFVVVVAVVVVVVVITAECVAHHMKLTFYGDVSKQGQRFCPAVTRPAG